MQISAQQEPLKIKCYLYKGKKISPLGRARVINKNTPKTGLTDKNIATLETLGEKGYILQEFEQPENMGKKYSESEYRRLSGLKSGEELSSRQKNALEFLNKLSLSDQKAFLNGLHKRRVLLKEYAEIADFASDMTDKIGLLINPAPLKELLDKNEIADFTAEMQKRFIYFVQQDAGVWSSFSKKTEENSQRFSQYEILQNNLISENKDIFRKAYLGDLTDAETLKQNITKCFNSVRNLAEPTLPDELCAEIIAQGIFQEAIFQKTDANKITKMNLLLNEFGINIDFKSLPITKIPSDEITGAAEQSKIDRQKFEELKRSKEYLDNEAEFLALLNRNGIVKADSASTHHYIALKYNPFVDEELNSNRFLVKTARAHAWNYDGHDTTHLYDTAGEFLIKNESGDYFLADFNHLRNRFKQGEKMEIQVPVLQTKNQDNEYTDLLALNEDKKLSYYVSDDKTAPVIKVPDYCKGGTMRSLKLKLEKKSGKTVA